jgi:hypothetical protein
MTTALWTLALAIGLLWPARSLSMFDGMPLDGRAEAIVIGVVFPVLWWLDRAILTRTGARVLVAALLALKIGGAWLGQGGLCARFSTAAPLEGAILTMPIDEPRGVLRSWDVRADWRADVPACTAILDRPYRSAAEFPAWFVNILDQLRPGHRDITMAVTGAITVPRDGTLVVRTGQDMLVRGRIGSADVQADAGRDVRVPLASGTHAIALDALLTGDRWRFVPEWNGDSAWNGALLTVAAPSAAGAAAGRIVGTLTTIVAVSLLAWWMASAIARVNPGTAAIGWTLAGTAVLIGMGVTGRFERAAGLLLVGSAWIPVATQKRNLRSAFVLVGVPWLAYFVARATPLIGHVSVYSWDDWLAYQVAGSRIYMHGFWLEGGSRTFDYQALYRWISGALHVLFGDSSVGETYLDASCLLAGALLAFSLVRPTGGFRAAILACAGTLATFTLGTPWYFVGRGLSEIAAAGLAFATAFFLMRARLGRLGLAAAAGALAILTFYARQNHLLFAASLAALLLPLSASMRPGSLVRGLSIVRWASAAVYGSVLAAGVALFAARTWWYTGAFSLLYGTSLKNNDTGLRLSTVLSLAPWQNVAHSLSALVWMNEPPRPDPRALLVAGGAVVAVAALCQVPRVREIPAAVVAVIGGSTLSSFLAHTHGYPGRMSIHLIPFAVTAAVIAVLKIARPNRGPVTA